MLIEISDFRTKGQTVAKADSPVIAAIKDAHLLKATAFSILRHWKDTEEAFNETLAEAQKNLGNLRQWGDQLPHFRQIVRYKAQVASLSKGGRRTIAEERLIHLIDAGMTALIKDVTVEKLRQRAIAFDESVGDLDKKRQDFLMKSLSGELTLPRSTWANWYLQCQRYQKVQRQILKVRGQTKSGLKGLIQKDGEHSTLWLRYLENNLNDRMARRLISSLENNLKFAKAFALEIVDTVLIIQAVQKQQLVKERSVEARFKVVD